MTTIQIADKPTLDAVYEKVSSGGDAKKFVASDNIISTLISTETALNLSGQRLVGFVSFVPQCSGMVKISVSQKGNPSYTMWCALCTGLAPLGTELNLSSPIGFSIVSNFGSVTSASYVTKTISVYLEKGIRYFIGAYTYDMSQPFYSNLIAISGDIVDDVTYPSRIDITEVIV